MDDSSVEKYIERGMKRVNEKSISRAARVQVCVSVGLSVCVCKLS